MKKVLAVVLLLCAASLLPGCGNASVPPYDKSQLEVSEYADTPVTGAVTIVLPEKTDFAKAEQITLRYENQTEQDYTFTAVQRLEALLDGTWYIVPDAQAFVTLQLLTLPGSGSVEDIFRFQGRYDPLPQGRYRILKSFSDLEGNPLLAAAEFTVE